MVVFSIVSVTCIPECQNNGTCHNTNQCRCLVGYKGDICDIRKYILVHQVYLCSKNIFTFLNILLNLLEEINSSNRKGSLFVPKSLMFHPYLTPKCIVDNVMHEILFANKIQKTDSLRCK